MTKPSRYPSEFKAGGRQSLNLIMARFSDETFAEIVDRAKLNRTSAAEQIRLLVERAFEAETRSRKAA